MNRRTISLRAVIVIVGLAIWTLPSLVRAEDWPQWRGPRGDGTSTETGSPRKRSAPENISWTVAIPGRGYSSPSIWGDRIFLTSCLQDEQKHVTYCLERQTGKILWQHDIKIGLQK